MKIRFLNAPPINGRPPFIPNFPCEKQNPGLVQKGWGYEQWLVNFPKYCAKILHFNKDKKFSDHYHIEKTELWYVVDGQYVLKVRDKQGVVSTFNLESGDVYQVEPGVSHQITCLEEGNIFEVSSEHFDEDSWRITKGD